MSNWAKLPVEILTIIFNDYIDSIRQLAKCRLVCQSWNLPAEVAMLGKQLDFNRELWELDFHEYISKKPAMAKHIKHVVMCDKSKYSTDEQLELWPIICTPSLQSISGVEGDLNVVKKLCDMYEESPQKFAGLKKWGINLPLQEPEYEEFAWYLKSNLEDLTLRVDEDGDNKDLINDVDQFKQLERLKIEVYNDGSLENWEEDVFQKCQDLTTLDIDFGRDEDVIPLESYVEGGVHKWIKYNNLVQQYTKLQTFTYNGKMDEVMLEYFLYKFPNIQDIDLLIDAEILDDKEFSDQRISWMLKKLDSKRRYSIYYGNDQRNSDFAAIIDSAKKKVNSLDIAYVYRPFFPTMETKLVKVDNKKSTAAFVIAASKVSLSDINCASDFQSLKLDFKDAKFTDPGQSKIQVLMQAMSTFDQLDRLDFTIDHIKEKDITQEQWPIHSKLATIKITGADLDANVFSTFDTCFPALKSLTLDQCRITTADDVVSQMYPVALPQRSLNTIAIVGLPASEGPTLTHLKLLSKASDLYFLLLPFQTLPVQLSKKQFYIHSSKESSLIFEISCQYVDTIRIKREGHISAALHVDEYIK